MFVPSFPLFNLLDGLIPLSCGCFDLFMEMNMAILCLFALWLHYSVLIFCLYYIIHEFAWLAAIGATDQRILCHSSLGGISSLSRSIASLSIKKVVLVVFFLVCAPCGVARNN